MFSLNSKIQQKIVKSCLSKQDQFAFFLIILLCFFIFPFTAYYLIPSIFKTQTWFFLVFSFEINSLSSIFSLLTIFIFFIGVFANWNLLISKFSIKFCANLSLFLFSNLLAFCSSTLFSFYFFFELTSLPILYFIIEFGKRNRRTKASQLFLSFTLLGSMCMFLVIFLDSTIVNLNPILSIFLLTTAFFIKLPIFPFYIWLPEAHVESPTIGSIFLAGISLKLGGFGIFKFLLPILKNSIYTDKILSLICILIFLSILFAAFSAILVHDFKKIIAYSSISHMGLFTLNLFLLCSVAKIGSLVGMIAHSFTASSLFFIAGIVYDKIKSRNTLYLSGLVTFMPICSIFLLFNILANLPFPGTLAFVSELIIYMSIIKLSSIILIIYVTLSILIAAFSFKLIKIFYFGNVNSYSKFKIKDINRRETVILTFLIIPQIFFGIFPNFLIEIAANF